MNNIQSLFVIGSEVSHSRWKWLCVCIGVQSVHCVRSCESDAEAKSYKLSHYKSVCYSPASAHAEMNIIQRCRSPIRWIVTAHFVCNATNQIATINRTESNNMDWLRNFARQKKKRKWIFSKNAKNFSKPKPCFEVETWNVSGIIVFMRNQRTVLFLFCMSVLRLCENSYLPKEPGVKIDSPDETKTRAFFSVKERVSSWIIYANLINWIAEQNN